MTQCGWFACMPSQCMHHQYYGLVQNTLRCRRMSQRIIVSMFTSVHTCFSPTHHNITCIYICRERGFERGSVYKVTFLCHPGHLHGSTLPAEGRCHFFYDEVLNASKAVTLQSEKYGSRTLPGKCALRVIFWESLLRWVLSTVQWRISS